MDLFFRTLEQDRECAVLVQCPEAEAEYIVIGCASYSDFIAKFDGMDDTCQCIEQQMDRNPARLSIIEESAFDGQPEDQSVWRTPSESWVFHENMEAYASAQEE